MNKRSWRDWVGLAARLILGAVLLIAGILKVGEPSSMELAIASYQLFPHWMVKLIAPAVPIAEIVLGALLILGLFTRFAAIWSALLIAAFIALIASAWARGLALDCGCFGGGGPVDPAETKYGEEILRDIGLLSLSLWLSVRPQSVASIDRWLFAVNVPEDDRLDDFADDKENQ